MSIVPLVVALSMVAADDPSKTTSSGGTNLIVLSSLVLGLGGLAYQFYKTNRDNKIELAKIQLASEESRKKADEAEKKAAHTNERVAFVEGRAVAADEVLDKVIITRAELLSMDRRQKEMADAIIQNSLVWQESNTKMQELNTLTTEALAQCHSERADLVEQILKNTEVLRSVQAELRYTKANMTVLQDAVAKTNPELLATSDQRTVVLMKDNGGGDGK